MNFVDYADDEMLAMGLVDVLSTDLRNALRSRDRVLFVVPGGTTPGPIFDGLCGLDLDWDRVDILLSDERWRPEVHLRSNTRLLRERLLRDRAAAARYLPLYAKSPEPETVLAELETNISPVLPIDVCLLGMGSDMHTASLFPGALCKHVVITGARKRAALERAQHMRPLEAPIAAVLAGATVHWCP